MITDAKIDQLRAAVRNHLHTWDAVDEWLSGVTGLHPEKHVYGEHWTDDMLQRVRVKFAAEFLAKGMS